MRIYEKENKAKQTLILRKSEDFQEDCNSNPIQIRPRCEQRKEIYRPCATTMKKCKKFALKR
jgi:hypothetical protein